MSPSPSSSESSPGSPPSGSGWRAARLAVFALLVGWSLANVYHTASRTFREHPAGSSDTVTWSEARFEELRRHLDDLGVVRVGYTMGRPAYLVSQDLSVAWQYYTAQFAVAPTVLDLELGDHTYVVGDFAASRTARENLPGFEVAHDFDDGIVLFRRSE